MTNQNLVTDEEFDRANVQEVAPGGPDDPFTQPNQQAPESVSAPTSPPAEPSAGTPPQEPAPVPPVETVAQQPAEAAPETPEEEDTTAPPPDQEAPQELTDEEYSAGVEELNTLIQTTVAQQVREQTANMQSGLDRRMAAERAAHEEQMAAVKAENRRLQAEGLTAEQREGLERQWEFDDRQEALDKREQGLTDYHDDLEIARLIQTYSEFGITEEQLHEVEFEEREAFCLEAKANALDEEVRRLRGEPAAQPNGQAPAPAPKPQAQQPPPAAPAGAQAPSDTGGGGVTPPPQRDEGTGKQAMTNNVGGGWETAQFPR